MKTILLLALIGISTTAFADCAHIQGSHLWKCDVPPKAPTCQTIEDELICDGPIQTPTVTAKNCSWSTSGKYVCK